MNDKKTVAELFKKEIHRRNLRDSAIFIDKASELHAVSHFYMLVAIKENIYEKDLYSLNSMADYFQSTKRLSKRQYLFLKNIAFRYGLEMDPLPKNQSFNHLSDILDD